MSPAFMLDTDTVSYWFRGEGRVREVVERHHRPELCISAITMAELRFGAVRRNSVRLHQFIDEYTTEVGVMPFDAACAIQYAYLANELGKGGIPIGNFDAMIAAHALVFDLTLVTNNTRHFSRVRGLRLENWL